MSTIHLPPPLQPLELLYASPEVVEDAPLPLPPALAQLYGPLSFPVSSSHPQVIGNFVETLDGVVALDTAGSGGGGEISGYNACDRAVMGLLRATADAVVVGAGTLRADPRHRWTASHIYPALAEAYQQLRVALGKPEPPLNVIVTASGGVDTSLPVFQSGEVPVLIVTTAVGMERLARASLPTQVGAVAPGATERLSAGDVLAAIAQVRAGDRILVEGGPHLMGDFLAERCLDELFLTLAPQVAGRGGAQGTHARPGFVAGREFAPEDPRWGHLTSIHRGGSHLFLRYAFAPTRAAHPQEGPAKS